MSLLAICQNVAEEAGFPAPSTIFTNTGETAIRLKALASLEGRTLARRFNWTALTKEHTFSTADGTSQYDLPSDFARFVPTTFWDRSNFWALQGPLTPQEWQELKSGIIDTFPRMKFRITPSSGVNKFTIEPEPTSVENLVYEYVSKNWVKKASDSTLTDDWSADGDEALIPEYLIELGLRWRFLNTLGLAYAEEKMEYDNELAKEQGWDGSARVLNMGRSSQVQLNIPEKGFGS